MRILFVIDKLEFKYFEFNKLVTNFWLIVEFLKRGYDVYVTTNPNLYLKGNMAYTKCYRTFFKNNELFKEENSSETLIESFQVVFFRPDPPVDIDYINACYILNYADKNKTLFINSPNAIKDKNEKLYINEFKGIAPDNIVTSSKNLIKEFLFEKREIIIKPLNRCFSSGVFYLKEQDKNINTIIDTATNNGTTSVMVQEFLPDIMQGDKRLIFICGEILPYCVIKKASNDDFKFNEHKDSNFLKGELTEAQRMFEVVLSQKFIKDGIYLAGLDVIEDKIIEINITSPCFFIKEINNLFGINLEKIIGDRLEMLIEKTFQREEIFCK